MLRRFELTLVARPLLREVQEQKLKALISFLPSVWRCEGDVQGLEMGEGRVHFRFQTESDLQLVLANRPYHYDGSMIALERWVPTVRRDFPNTIPFWIVIKGLPDYRREAASVRSIGEALGEFLESDVSEPIPRVRVTLNGDSPLQMRCESDDAGQICALDLKYEKLHKFCTCCFRLTHEASSCPERVRDRDHHREQRLDRYRRAAEDDKRGPQRNLKAKRGKAERGKAESLRSFPHVPKRRNHEVMASSSRPKPVKRDLLPELETSGAISTAANPSTKEWVRKAFAASSRDSMKSSPTVVRISPSRDSKRANPRAPWYRTTVEEAAMDNELEFQQGRWEEANRVNVVAGKEKSPEKQRVASGEASDAKGIGARVLSEERGQNFED
ncbi:hypothetical protein AALP_AA7G064100 [Arabis alpina]|uniref:DUF4283 domain-containing protein n=1 Tax=Arabis alpina TaxID=50452 RepID=A0A087GGB0_ARAAL|nr:hypothetical protein AALP_AA7G064100 [Arabis alpina]